MDTMTLTKEQMELKAMVPTVQSGNARVRELTPAQRRAVMFAQQQVLRARAAKKAKDERQAALTRIWREEDAERVSARSMSAATETTDEPREFRFARPSAMYCAICAPMTTKRCVR